MSLEGTTLAGYRVGEVLGRGGMGIVYRARQISLNRDVALKVLNDSGAAVESVARRFRREARIHHELSHPHLVPVFDSGHSEGRAYIAMELVIGSPLSQLITKRGPMSAPAVVAMCADLLEALAYLHRQGVLHRDLKPANILVARTGMARIVDFGLARRLDQTLITVEQEFAGTIPYSAPEILGGDDPSAAADVYAMGLVMVEMLTGQRVFQQTHMKEAVDAIVSGPVPLPRFDGRGDLAPELASILDDLVERMVARDPARRPTAEAAAKRLREGHSLLWDPGSSEMTGPMVPPRAPLPLHRLLVPAATVLIGVAGIAILGIAWRARPVPAVRPSPVMENASGSPADMNPAGLASATGTARTGEDDTVAWMRVQIQEAFDLLRKYDLESPDPDVYREPMIVREGMLGEEYFRQRVGDVSKLFSALSRVRGVIERGDEEKTDDPVWMDLERVAYEIVDEAARSNGFDSKSALRPQLLKLRELLSRTSTGRYRTLVPQVLLGQMKLSNELSGENLLEVASTSERVLANLEATPTPWLSSPRGRVTRLNLRNRIGDLLSHAPLFFEEPEAAAVIRRVDKARLDAFEFVRASVPGNLEVETDLESWLLWQRFQAIAASLPRHDSGSDASRQALGMLNAMAPRLDFGTLRPMDRSFFRITLTDLVEASRKDPSLKLHPRLIEQYDATQKRYGPR